MSRKALIESLRVKAAEDAEALWRDARADAEAYRTELAQALDRQRAQGQQATAAAARRLEEAATAEAQRRAREARTNASIALAERLHGLAVAELPRLASEGGETLFTALAAELPGLDWQLVRVGPGDKAVGGRHFPRARIVCDESVAGGLEAEAEEGRIVLSNTLEARLATAWPDILPGLIAGLFAEAPGRGNVA